jgi:hypothetical protein
MSLYVLGGNPELGRNVNEHFSKTIPSVLGNLFELRATGMGIVTKCQGKMPERLARNEYRPGKTVFPGHPGISR